MSGTIRRTMAGVAAGAVVVVGLAGCGPVPGDAPQTGTQGTTQPVATSTTTPPTVDDSDTLTARPTPTAPAAPTTSTPTTPSPPATRKATPTPTATAKPKPTATPTPDKPEPTPTPTAAPRQDIRVGDHGPKVLTLQNRLSELGYWLGEPDGDYGFLTQQAVWAFQKAAGLSRDGKVGPATQRALANGIRPATQLSGNGIDINLSRQILMIVRDGRVQHILNTSTGGGYEYKQKDGDTVTAHTPKGTFKVYYTVDGEDQGFLGDMWRPRYFNGGYAVHGSPSIPPYPASHGCARVSNAAMNMIWARDLMPKGSTVLVR